MQRGSLPESLEWEQERRWGVGGSGNFPLGVISEVVFIVGERDGDEGELESSGEPTGGSRDSGEDLVVVVRGKC